MAISSKSPFLEECNSDQEAASNKMLYPEHPNVVTLHVESEIDIPFWYAIFRIFAPELKIKFNFVKHEGTGNEIRGKDYLLKRFNDDNQFVSDKSLICIDSDYDYLVSTTSNAKTVNSSKYIFQTYTYAIENYKCLPESLSCICVDATCNEEIEFDFEGFLRGYSEAIYELFIYTVYSKCKGIEELPINWKCDENIIFNGKQTDINDNGKAAINTIQIKTQKIADKIRENWMKKNRCFDVEIWQLKDNLENHYGVTSKNIYLFMNGHALEKVVQSALRMVVCKLKTKMHEKITDQNSVKKETKPNPHTRYEDAMPRFESLLKGSKAHFFHDCFLLKKIESDIKGYLEERNGKFDN